LNDAKSFYISATKGVYPLSKILSLCLTTQNKYDKDKSLLFRIADYSDCEFREVRNFEYDESQYVESNHRHPYTNYRDHNIGELAVWDWDPSSSEWARRKAIPFYELIRVTEMEFVDVNNSISCLKEGVNIPRYHGQRALIVTNDDDEYFDVIKVDSTVLKIHDECVKLKKNISKLEGYRIRKEDFIHTYRVKEFSEDDKELPVRAIYKYSDIDLPSFVIETLSLNEKLKIFMKKQINTRNFSRMERRNINNLFTEILSDYDLIDCFFRENNFDREDLKEKVQGISKCVNDVIGDDSLRDELCKVMIEHLPILTNQYSSLVEEKFFEDKQEQIEMVDSDIYKKNGVKSALDNEIRECQKSLDDLMQKKSEIERANCELELVNSSLKVAMNEKLSDVREDLSSFIAEMTLLGVLNSGSRIADRFGLSYKEGQLYSNTDDELFDLNEFSDSLAINLGIAGIKSVYKESVSKYITGSIIQGNNLLLTGRFSESVANAISATVCGREADIISVNSHEISCDEVIEQIRLSKSKVVGIANIITQNENITFQLMKSNIDKLIIFINDLSETVTFLPNSLWNWCNLLCLDFICERKDKEAFIYTDSQNVSFRSCLSKSVYKQVVSEIQALPGNIVYSSTHCSTKAELITLVNGFEENEGLFTWVLCEVIPLCLLNNENEYAEELMSMIEIANKQEALLKDII